MTRWLLKCTLGLGLAYAPIVIAYGQAQLLPVELNQSLRVPPKEIPRLDRRAKKGDIKAALALANHYGFYLNARQHRNRAKQLMYYKLAANHGSDVAIHNLIRIYSTDPRRFSFAEALRWRRTLRSLASRRNIPMQSDADWYYDLYMEHYVARDNKKRGLFFLRKAAQLGSDKARRELTDLSTTPTPKR